MAATVLGRDDELASIRDFVAGIPDGASTLVLEGEAGMGKTTLWRSGIEVAEGAGLRVLEAQPAESETALSFSGLGDLFDPVLDEAMAPLPPGQRSALARALVLEEVEGPPPDAHAVGIAVLNGLRALATSRSALVAVDDVQWLDAASAAALAYAARRLRTEAVGLLLARRTGLESPVLEELKRTAGCDVLDVSPLAPDPLRQVVQTHLGVALPRPLLSEVHQAAAGNPFYALEIVRTLTRTGVSVEAGKPLPVPDSLHELVHARLLALPFESRDFLTAAAAHAHPTISMTETASGVQRDVALGPALDARIVETSRGRIRFTHPLLAAGALETADPRRRREVHARLAELLEDPEARAWQLAASVDRPDEGVAAVLEDAARHARARGAPRPAALLLERAGELTPATKAADASRRAIDAAYMHYESGDSQRAEAQLRDVIASLSFGRERARALMRLARVLAYTSLTEAARIFQQAVDEAEGDPEVLAVAHEGVATCLFRLDERLTESVEHAELAARFASELENDALVAESLGTKWAVESLLGRTASIETGERALAFQPATERGRVLAQPRFACAAGPLRWSGGLREARDELLDLVARAKELGDESSRPLLLATLGGVECELGLLESARVRAVEGQDASEQAGQETVLALNLALECLVDAQLGQAEAARTAGQRALDLAPTTGGRAAELTVATALGHLELSLGAAGAADALLAQMVDLVRREAIAEPGAAPYVIDEIEALVELGRRDEAIELLDWYEGNARRLERVSALANCLRCRGLLAAAEGDVDEAIALYGDGLALHERVELPLDRGRTLLALGAAQRRLKRRREARATLEEALETFERIGAAVWAERARAELKRISGRAATPGSLTPAEQRVAALVAEGKTNREVAAALFLSERTVEGHLSRIFGKLGVRHRTEISSVLAPTQTQGAPSSNTGGSPVSAESPAP